MNDHKISGIKIPEKDWELLHFIHSLKILTVSQLSALSRRSHQVIRRRLRVLSELGYISTRQRGYGNKHGRPEAIFQLSAPGYSMLNKQMGLIGKDRRHEKYAATSEFVEHELLVNWFLIHLIKIERQIPEISVNYVTQNFSTAENGPTTENMIRIQLPAKDDVLAFIPDGIFTVSDSVSNKMLLFFLEVDMGTETLANPVRGLKDVRQKIANYQDLFRSGRYKRYERYFNSRLNGFRLLFVTHAPSRLKALCRLTASMPPSNFIWLTDKARMFSKGLLLEIWIKGGQWNSGSKSIFGRGTFCNQQTSKSTK